MTDKIKFIIFSLGLATSIGSAITTIIILLISLLGGKSIVYEPNSIVAFTEIIFLTLSVATCFTASEIYYRYLKMKNNQKQGIYPS